MYNAKNVQIVKNLEPGILKEGIIIEIEDGKIKDFVKGDSLKKFRDPEHSCIQVTTETKYKGEPFRDMKLFTYKEGEDSLTQVQSNSNLGKYYSYYNKLPEVGDKVKLMTDGDGFFKIVFK